MRIAQARMVFMFDAIHVYSLGENNLFTATNNTKMGW